MNPSKLTSALLTLVVLVGAITAPVAATSEQTTTTTTPTNTTTQSPPVTETAATTPRDKQSSPTATPVPQASETATETETERMSTPTPTETESPTQTVSETPSSATADGCSVSKGESLLSHKRLYAPETTIDTESPGQIAGGFQAAPTVDCPIVVRITMEVPSGMEVSGSADVLSGGAGMVSGTFIVDDSSGIEDIRATVYGTETGDRTVTADITYWPQGHEEMAQSIDGLRFTFQVESPSEPEYANTTATDASPSVPTEFGGVPFTWAVTGALLTLLFVALVRGRQ